MLRIAGTGAQLHAAKATLRVVRAAASSASSSLSVRRAWPGIPARHGTRSRVMPMPAASVVSPCALRAASAPGVRRVF